MPQWSWSSNRMILIRTLLVLELLVALAFGICRVSGDLPVEYVEYLAEIVLSKDKPVDENQPKEIYPIRLTSIDFEKQQACIEIQGESGWKKYCAKERGFFGRGIGIELMKVAADYVVIHLSWPGQLGEEESRRETNGKWKPSQPLHLAAANGDIQNLKKLIENNPDIINAQDKHRMTPLMWAAYNGREGTVKFLLEKGASQDADHRPARFCQTPLHLAIKQGHEEIAKILLNKKADVNAEDIFGATSLDLAALKGREDLVGLLISNGADVNHAEKDGDTPLHTVLKTGHRNIRIAELLLSYKASINATNDEGETPLHIAAYKGDVKIAQLLLARKANLGAKDKEGKTPLHRATEMGNTQTVELLLAHGADVNAKDNESRTPLHYWAQDVRDVETAEVLLSNGADADAMDIENKTPLHYAADRCESEAVELLLANKADVNAKDASDSTPLHLAATKGIVGVIRILLSHGADVNAKNNCGRTPLELAIEERDMLATKFGDCGVIEWDLNDILEGGLLGDFVEDFNNVVEEIRKQLETVE